MTDYQTIVTAAGDSRPLFLGSGFSTPKSLVLRRDSPVIVKAVRSYSAYPAHTSVAISRDEDEEWPISDVLREEFPGIAIHRVPGDAKGALISALMAAGDVVEDQPLVIAAGDSCILGGIQEHVSTLLSWEVSAGTIAFRSDDPRWSYLAVNSSNVVTQIAEKSVIGPFATTGVFFFRRGSDFLEAAEWCLVNSAHHRNQYYVSTALNQLLVAGHAVSFVEIPREDYIPSGLPVDFLEYPRD